MRLRPVGGGLVGASIVVVLNGAANGIKRDQPANNGRRIFAVGAGGRGAGAKAGDGNCQRQNASGQCLSNRIGHDVSPFRQVYSVL